MKSGRVFWGTLFVILGGLILINNFMTLHLPWEQIWRFWPVVLILIGVSALSKGSEYRWIINAVIAIVAGFVLFASVQSGCTRISGIFEKNGKHGRGLYTKTIEADYDSTMTRARFVIDGGAGRYTIEDTTSKMISAWTRSTFGKYRFKRTIEDGIALLKLQMDDANIRLQGGSLKNSVHVSLNPAPVWDFDLNIGAAAMELDLTPFRVNELALDAGAASIEIKLGALNELTKVNIDAGASSITILVPESAGCEIRSDVELSSSNFIGFERLDEKLFRTKGFTSATHRIMVEIDAGVSSIEVRRYKDDVPFAPAPDADSLIEESEEVMF